MDLVNGVLDYNLPEPITVHMKSEGGDVEVHLLALREPRREHVKYSAKMKQMVARACMEVSKHQTHEIQESAPAEEPKSFHDKTDEEHVADAEETIGALRAALFFSETVDLGDFVENFISMAIKTSKKSIILCDDKVPIRDIHFEQMSEKDVTELAITYSSFFIMPSVMQDKS